MQVKDIKIEQVTMGIITIINMVIEQVDISQEIMNVEMIIIVNVVEIGSQENGKQDKIINQDLTIIMIVVIIEITIIIVKEEMIENKIISKQNNIKVKM